MCTPLKQQPDKIPDYFFILFFLFFFFFTIFRYLLGATTDAVLASRGRYCDTTRPFVGCIMLLDCYVWR